MGRSCCESGELIVCGGGKAPSTPTVDPAAERQKAADEAAKKANEALIAESRRRRGQKGLLASEQGAGTVLGKASGSAYGPEWGKSVMASGMERLRNG